MLAHLIDHPIQLPSGLKMLSLPFKLSKPQPVSEASTFKRHSIGQPLHCSAFTEKLKKSFSQSGNLKLAQNTNLSLTDRNLFCIRGTQNCYTTSVNSVLKFYITCTKMAVTIPDNSLLA